MNKPPYSYNRTHPAQYHFTSIGKTSIVKKVEFTATHVPGVVNLAFGDILPGGMIDDKSTSNNGDLVQIMATVINIILEHTLDNPDLIILFHGSTPIRTRLYARILKTYYSELSMEFNILGIIPTDPAWEEPFDPGKCYEYEAFLIQRIY